MRKPERFANEDLDAERRKGTRFGTLWADYQSGEADVTLTLEFCYDNPLMRADLLMDVIGLLQHEYDKAREEMSKEYGKKYGTFFPDHASPMSEDSK
jgi:hypothetical protein